MCIRDRPRAALDNGSGVGDGDLVFGIGVREHPAFVDHIKVKQRVPPHHLMALRLVVGRQLHQAEVGKIVGIHIISPIRIGCTSNQ